MRPQTRAGEYRHHSDEDHNRHQKVPQEDPRAFPSKAKRSEPIEAEDRSTDEDDPISVRGTGDVEWRLHRNPKPSNYPQACTARNLLRISPTIAWAVSAESPQSVSGSPPTMVLISIVGG